MQAEVDIMVKQNIGFFGYFMVGLKLALVTGVSAFIFGLANLIIAPILFGAAINVGSITSDTVGFGVLIYLILFLLGYYTTIGYFLIRWHGFIFSKAGKKLCK